MIPISILLISTIYATSSSESIMTLCRQGVETSEMCKGESNKTSRLRRASSHFRWPSVNKVKWGTVNGEHEEGCKVAKNTAGRMTVDFVFLTRETKSASKKLPKVRKEAKRCPHISLTAAFHSCLRAIDMEVLKRTPSNLRSQWRERASRVT
jgi:hypothetical protein